MSEREQVSREVRAPFCVLQSQFVRESGSPWPLLVILVIAGAAILCFSAWDAIQAFPDYHSQLAMPLLGVLLLWGAFKLLQTARRDRRYWLGIDADKLSLMREGVVVSWLWSEISAFRVIETINAGFETRDKPPGLDPEVNFVRTATISLFAPVLQGPPIEVAFNRFVDTGQERDRAENFCMFLNDVRERGRSGRLVQAAFLAPIELNIVPMKNGVPASARRMSLAVGQSAVQRP